MTTGGTRGFEAATDSANRSGATVSSPYGGRVGLPQRSAAGKPIHMPETLPGAAAGTEDPREAALLRIVRALSTSGREVFLKSRECDGEIQHDPDWPPAVVKVSA